MVKQPEDPRKFIYEYDGEELKETVKQITDSYTSGEDRGQTFGKDTNEGQS
ncbi:hypothetical protein [Peribacillus glennii]|uniref:hypothetical protein n=1 Tax=Peribacillus glennii TaxID=2303991 RepID=UPI0013142C5A|nr:hypothetical protein [Peribacillus glennii]